MIKTKFLVLAASLLAIPAVIFSTVALAAGMGQIEGGDIYRVRNVTQNTGFTDPVSATCNETVQFKVRLHNPGPSRLDNVRVVATLPNVAATTHVSRMTASSPTADPASTSDTATVNLNRAGRLAYIAGSTDLLDHNGVKIATLPDTITSSGVTLPNGVGVSLQEIRYVQFKAKVNCPETPPPADIQVCELATKRIITIREDQFNPNLHTRDLSKCAEVPPPGNIVVCEVATGRIITIKENEFDANKHSRDLNRCVKPPVTPGGTTPTVLPDTGTGEILAMVASVVAGGMLAYRLVWTRFNA